ncbi:hypothetical protein L2E82_15898 [Cichorium intybus]|uniref:Uncharacterized protein n=1 Tax=Cichorium intybus TaxID=13427 RepID=A0ACB9F5C2_CICIN|nr:hypothetical protein L2E82_15898 [Cichorium intybus]
MNKYRGGGGGGGNMCTGVGGEDAVKLAAYKDDGGELGIQNENLTNKLFKNHAVVLTVDPCGSDATGFPVPRGSAQRE